MTPFPTETARPSWQPFAAVEALSFASPTHSARILLALDGAEGWVFAVDCERRVNGVCGWGEPLGRGNGQVRADRRADTRADAIAAAGAVIRSRMPDPPLIDWIKSLAEAQPDLFPPPHKGPRP